MATAQQAVAIFNRKMSWKQRLYAAQIADFQLKLCVPEV